MSIDAFLTRVPDKLANDEELRDYFDQLNRAVSDLTILSQAGTTTTTIETVIAATVDIPVTNAKNIGAGFGLFKQLDATILEFDSLIGGTGITITDTTDDLTVLLTVPVNAGTVEDAILHWNNSTNQWDELSEVTMNWVAGVLTIQALDDAAALQNILTADADGSLVNYFDGTIAAGTLIDGIFVQDTVADDPAITFRDNAAAELSKLSHIGATQAEWRNLEHGIPSRISGEDNGGTLRTLLHADPDSDVNLYFQGIRSFSTRITGIAVYDTNGSSPIIDFRTDAGLTVSQLLHSSGIDFSFKSLDHGLKVAFDGEDAGGVLRALLEADPDAGVDLFFAGDVVLGTDSAGISINHPTVDDPRIALKDNSSVLLTTIQHVGGQQLRFDNKEHGAGMLFRGEDAVGALKSLITADPDTDVTLYFNGVRTLATQVTGVSIFDANGSSPIINMRSDAGVTLSQFLHSGGSNFAFKSLDHGVPVDFTGEDAGGVLRTLISADPDGAADLYFAGTLELSTKSGGVIIDDELEINGALNHDGATVGFYGTVPVAQQTGVAVTAAAIHAALVNLGLITA